MSVIHIKDKVLSLVEQKNNPIPDDVNNLYYNPSTKQLVHYYEIIKQIDSTNGSKTGSRALVPASSGVATSDDFYLNVGKGTSSNMMWSNSIISSYASVSVAGSSELTNLTCHKLCDDLYMLRFTASVAINTTSLQGQTYIGTITSLDGGSFQSVLSTNKDFVGCGFYAYSEDGSKILSGVGLLLPTGKIFARQPFFVSSAITGKCNFVIFCRKPSSTNYPGHDVII